MKDRGEMSAYIVGFFGVAGFAGDDVCRAPACRAPADGELAVLWRSEVLLVSICRGCARKAMERVSVKLGGTSDDLASPVVRLSVNDLGRGCSWVSMSDGSLADAKVGRAH